MPEWGEERISNMVSSRPDWCISRQRVWGVPIVVFYCSACREPLTDRKILDSVVDLFESIPPTSGSNEPPPNWCPPGTVCRKCGGGGVLERERHSRRVVRFRLQPSRRAQRGKRSALARRSLHGRRRPVSRLVPEFVPDRRGLARCARRSARCATHGWTLDGDGRPLSKSLGNGTAPEEIIKEYGAELIRLWTASVAFHRRRSHLAGDPDAGSPKPIASCATPSAMRSATCTISIRRPMRFQATSCSNSISGSWCAPKKWFPAAASGMTNSRSTRSIAPSTISPPSSLSSIYFDVLKDRLYTSAPKSHARRSAQTALYRLAFALVRLLAPILSFTTEEVWAHLASAGSVHTAYFPEVRRTHGRHRRGRQRQRVENWQRLIAVREEVQKSLETARQEKIIGAPLEARVQLSGDSEIYPLLNRICAGIARARSSFPRSNCRTMRLKGVKVAIDRARRDKVRALLEVHRRRRVGCRIPDCLCGLREPQSGTARKMPDRSRRIVAFLIAARGFCPRPLVEVDGRDAAERVRYEDRDSRIF